MAGSLLPHRRNMTMQASAVWGFVLTTFAAVGCGNIVLVPGETEGAGAAGAGGQGGEATTTSTSTSTSTATSTSPTTSTTTSGIPMIEDCTPGCSAPSNGVDTCNCTFECTTYPGHVEAWCEPNVDLLGNHKVKCVCKISDVFTGICFETKPEFLCDFEQGCCGKYAGK